MKSDRQIFFRPERCLLCLSCVLACRTKITGGAEDGGIGKDQRPGAGLKVTFTSGTPWVWKCQQCRIAPCVEACFTGALHRENGTVVQDRDVCVGCGSCMLACPIEGVTLQPGEQRPDKCDACRDENVPACVQACQSRALVYTEGQKFAAEKRRRFVANTLTTSRHL